MALADPTRMQLMTDALSVLDLLDSQHPQADPLDPVVRRQQLTTLVTEACQKGGRPYSSQDIEQAVNLWFEQQRPLVPVAPAPTVPLTQRMTRTALGVREGIVRWWRSRAALTRTMTVGTALSVGGALFLVLTPWTSVFRAPFVLAATHGALYCILLLAFLGVCAAAAKHGSDTDNDDLTYGAITTLFLCAMVGIFGGGLAAISAHSTEDARKMLHGIEVVDTTMAQAKTKLRPGVPLSDVVATANDLVMADRSTNFRDVGDFNAKTGIIQRTGQFNPNECRRLTEQLSTNFHVVSVNGQAVGNGPLHCPFIWDNDVTIESKPGAF